MFRILTLLFIVFLFYSCSRNQYTVIENVDVFNGDKIIQNVDFVFSEDKIIEISEKPSRYNYKQIIDGYGKTIIPPMINAHVHVRTSDNLSDALDHGIFALLDMFSTDTRANGLRAYNDSLVYAKYFSSNIGATPPRGHGTQFGVPIPTINDSLSPIAFVKERVSALAAYIKITHETSMARLEYTDLEQVIDAAHEHELKAIAHISDLESGLEVVKAGADGLAHIWYRKHSMASEEHLDSIKAKGTFVIPTLSVIEKLIVSSIDNGLEDKFLSFDELKAEVHKLYTHKIPILAGTDSPNFGMDFTTQFFEELILLSECGLSNLDILQTATVNIYDAFDLKDFNRLEKNMDASFILVSGKPHIDIKEIKHEKMIWKHGIEI